MGRLPSFSRGFVVVDPHGSYISEGIKTHLVKARRYQMANEKLLVIQQKQALAVIEVGEPVKITPRQFKARRGHHLVTEVERKRWWPGKRAFYYYPIQRVRRLRRPVPIDYPQGPQVFVRKENITVR